MTEDRMSAFDFILHRGESDPRTRSSVVSVEVLDRAPDWDRFVLTFDRASRTVARLRQKVVVPALPTTGPRWVVDPDFDLAFHVRRIRLPEPGTRRQLLDFAEQVVSSMLDLSRPLWTATLVEGLEDGTAALVTHMSHAVTDGVGAIELFAQLYDLGREADRGPLPPLPAPLDLTPVELARSGLGSLPSSAASTLAGAVTGVAGRASRVLGAPVDAATEAYAYARSAARVLGADAVEPSPLLRRRGITRRVVTLDLDLDRVKAAGKTLGGSVNDIYLAGLCAALRLYHEEKGVPVATLPMAIPVSIRAAGDADAGNRFAAVRLAAPIGETDTRVAVHRIRTQVVQGRGEPALEVVDKVAGLLAVLPDALLEMVAGGLTSADIQASNVPSYPEATYLAGAQIIEQYALGPLPGIAAMVAMVSRMGRCFVAFRYDTASFTDDPAVERCLAAGFEEVLAHGGQPGDRTPPGPTAGRAAAQRSPAKRATGTPAKRATAAPTKPESDGRGASAPRRAGQP
jgi:WS/DGAT/MGAT family acyltransferase